MEAIYGNGKTFSRRTPHCSRSSDGRTDADAAGTKFEKRGGRVSSFRERASEQLPRWPRYKPRASEWKAWPASGRQRPVGGSAHKMRSFVRTRRVSNHPAAAAAAAVIAIAASSFSNFFPSFLLLFLFSPLSLPDTSRPARLQNGQLEFVLSPTYQLWLALLL